MSRFHDELFKQKGPKHDVLVIQCVSKEGLERISNEIGAVDDLLKKHVWLSRKELQIDYETEVLCQSHGYKSNFIIGYADILIKLFVQRDEDPARYGLPAGSPCQMREILAKILVECKPELTDIGSVLRQIKTYKSLLYDGRSNFHNVIASYDEPPQKVIDYLKHEGVEIVIFEEGA